MPREQGSEIAPRRRGGHRVNKFLIKKFSELCELCASVVHTSSRETRNNQKLDLTGGKHHVRTHTHGKTGRRNDHHFKPSGGRQSANRRHLG